MINFKNFSLKEGKNEIDNLILKIRNQWIENFGEDAEEEAMYSDCDSFAADIIDLLEENNIKYDLLNSITYTKRIGGISGVHSLLKRKTYKKWYSKLPETLNDDNYFGEFEFPYHEWLYIDGKHYDFINYNGVDSVFDMTWIKDYFNYVEEEN